MNLDGWRLTLPEALALLPLVPALIWWATRRRRRPALIFSSADLFLGVGPSWRQRALWLIPALRAVALVALIVALARPQQGVGTVRTTSRGVAIMAVVDRSASMSLPMSFEGREAPRLDVVKEVFNRFVIGDGRRLKGRPEDLIGLVSFALFPETVCPLVRIHDTLTKLVNAIAFADQQFEAGTAIGDGLALAAARLRQAEADLAERQAGEAEPDFTIASKVIILLTDGDENQGEVRAAEAAEACRQWGIRIYAVGIGDDRGGVVQTPMGAMRLPAGQGFNEALMKSIAESTGGLYRRATDGESLERIYQEIGTLEKTEVRSVEFTSYRERFVPWAVAGTALLLFEFLLARILLRRVP